MEIAVAHNNTDFDSLASQFAITKLYAGARMAPSSALGPEIKEFLALYRDQLPIVDMAYVDLDKITHVYVVDCQHLERLEKVVRDRIENNVWSYTVFDHHVLDESGLIRGARDDSEIQRIGACTSLLVDKIRHRGIELQPMEATLLLIGIYEDTGCMTYSGTTQKDAECVAYLLSHGADLNQVNSFINPKLSAEQTELFQVLVKSARAVTISGAQVTLASATCDRYVEGLASLTRRVMEVSSSDAALTAVWMRDRVHLVGRSDSSKINVRTVCRQFGGDGHVGAASAVVKKVQPGDLDKLLLRVEHVLRADAAPEPTAADIMSSPVRTIKPEVTMDEASRIMLRYGGDGLVVTAGDGSLVGVVSKRDVDKAAHHKLGHAPVRGFMSSPVISAKFNAPLSELQKTMVKNDIGRVPILNDAGELIGIVSRKDILRTVFGADAAADSYKVDARHRRFDFSDRLKQLDEHTLWLFEAVGQAAKESGMAAYAVGGCVRDLYMNRPNFDLDFVIEGAAPELAHALERAHSGRLRVVAEHERFRTATLVFQADAPREVDLSTARTEFYEFPAALPTVEPSHLEHDLYRRDFTINSLALSINEGEFGDVIDFFDGIADINDKLIRILHSFSFIEDPTRIIRAVRFASRFGFKLEAKTRRQAERAIEMGVFENLGGFRLKEELKIILESPHRLKALELLRDLGGGLRYLASDLTFDETLPQVFRRAHHILQRNRLDSGWIVYLALLLAPLRGNAEALAGVMDRLVLSNHERDWISDGLRLSNELPGTAGGGDTGWLPRSVIYKTLHGHAQQSLAIAASLCALGTPARRWIKLYLDELREVKPALTGHDLLRIGLPQGPLIKEALQKLHVARLDGEVKTDAEELELLKRSYPEFVRQ